MRVLILVQAPLPNVTCHIEHALLLRSTVRIDAYGRCVIQMVFITVTPRCIPLRAPWIDIFGIAASRGLLPLPLSGKSNRLFKSRAKPTAKRNRLEPRHVRARTIALRPSRTIWRFVLLDVFPPRYVSIAVVSFNKRLKLDVRYRVFCYAERFNLKCAFYFFQFDFSAGNLHPFDVWDTIGAQPDSRSRITVLRQYPANQLALVVR